MIKPIMQLAATGVVAVVLWKLAAIVLLPLLGVAVGILAVLLKLLFLALGLSLAWLVYRWLTRNTATG